MAKNKKPSWNFSSYEDLEEKYLRGEFDCDDISAFDDPLILDWCERLADWAPKVALCFNKNTSAVTLDRLSQCDLLQVRRLVCYHTNASIETLERLLADGERECRESAQERLETKASGKRWANGKKQFAHA